MQRKIFADQIYHIYNRSVCKIPLFREQADYIRFLLKISVFKKRYPVQIIAYCLMPNHFHLLLREPEKSFKTTMSNISFFLQQLQNSYAKYFGIKYKHSGRVFQGVFKSKHIKNDEQLFQTIDYIHNNPVRKKMVRPYTRWPYSSASNPAI